MPTFFFYPVLQALSNGKIIRKSVAIALQVLGVLVVLGGLYLLVQILKIAFQLPQTEATIGGLLFAAIFLAATLCVGQVFWYHAGSVRDLGESPFTVIPIVSILLRAAGEVYATVLTAIGVGGCLFIWLARGNPLWLLSGLGGILPSIFFGSSENTFVGGLSFLLSCSVASFCMLILFYFLGEATVVLVDVARHVRMLVRQGATDAGIGSAGSRCLNCSAELDPNSSFCSSCGVRVVTDAGTRRH